VSRDVLIRQLQGALGGDRLIRGTVELSGTTATIARGAGFSMTRTGVGGYDVTFDEPFAEPPSVLISPEGAGAAGAKSLSVTENGFTVGIFTTTSGANLDLSWSFLALGPTG
jgi:hypothetical protein